MRTSIVAIAILALLSACSADTGETSAPGAASRGETPAAAANPPAFSATRFSEGLPADFPKDIPLVDSMAFVTVAKVGDAFMAAFQAKDTSLDAVVDWFKVEMPKQGWRLDAITVDDRSAFMPFTKDGRGCGIKISAFALDASGEMDESVATITISTPAVE